MNASLWLVAALVLVPAAQVPLVLYLSRYVELEESERPADPTGEPTPRPEWRPDQHHRAATDGARCRRCGTENEPGYRFCRACAAAL